MLPLLAPPPLPPLPPPMVDRLAQRGSDPHALRAQLPPAARPLASAPARRDPVRAAASDARLLAVLPADLIPLARDLQRHGFALRLAPPPAAGAYGQYVAASRTLWLAPIAVELGIGRQTFLHEAVHAVQSCPAGRLTPIGWTLPLDPVVEQEIRGILTLRYHHGNRLLEREAFSLQGQPDAVARLRTALRRRCRPAP